MQTVIVSGQDHLESGRSHSPLSFDAVANSVVATPVADRSGALAGPFGRLSDPDRLGWIVWKQNFRHCRVSLAPWVASLRRNKATATRLCSPRFGALFAAECMLGRLHLGALRRLGSVVWVFFVSELSLEQLLELASNLARLRVVAIVSEC